MKVPFYIKQVQRLSNEVFSTMKINLPGNFDKFIEGRKITLVYSESTKNFETNELNFHCKIYQTQQGFYLYLLFNKDDEISLTVFYNEKQSNELIIFMNQLLKNFKNK